MINIYFTAALLGLKHALDPDHLAATLNMVTLDKASPKDAAKLGYSWGTGHAASMLILGLPVVIMSTKLPDWVYSSAEFLVGLIIVGLAVQLASQWTRGKFHLHKPQKSKHFHKRAFGMGMLHGLGGSYVAALLMLTSFNNTLTAALGLIMFSLFTIFSMSVVTTAFSYMVLHHKLIHIFNKFILPLMIAGTLVFGVVYMHESWPF